MSITDCPSCGDRLEATEVEKIGTGMSPRRWTETEMVCAGCRSAQARGVPDRFRWARTGTGLGQERITARVRSPAAIQATSSASKLPRVVWMGASGTGKTSLGCAALMEGPGGLFVPAWELSRARAKHPLGEGDPPIVIRAKRCDRLLIDDLGTDTADIGTVFEVVCDRYDHDLSTWATTWLSVDELKKRYGDGFTRRLLEGARVIDCTPSGPR